jgi:hypothetical protein
MLKVIMLRVIMLSVVIQNVIMQNVIVQNVVMLNVIMLSCLFGPIVSYGEKSFIRLTNIKGIPFNNTDKKVEQWPAL